MAAVGFDLYTRLLAEAVEEREGRARGSGRRSSRRPTAVIDLPVDAYLPDDYVPEEPQKLELYRRLARATTEASIAAVATELLDRYGPPPSPVERLLEVARLRYHGRGGRADLGRPRGWPAGAPLPRGWSRLDDGPGAWRRAAPAIPIRSARRRPHLRLEPGPTAAAARSRARLAPDAPRRRAPRRSGRRRLIGPGARIDRPRFVIDGCPPTRHPSGSKGRTTPPLARRMMEGSALRTRSILALLVVVGLRGRLRWRRWRTGRERRSRRRGPDHVDRLRRHAGRHHQRRLLQGHAGA